jgi:hypothetical protein
MEHFGVVDKNGKLELTNKEFFLKDVAKYANKEIKIIVLENKHKRSNKQNNYYWAVIVPLCYLGFINKGYRLSKGEVGLKEAHHILKSVFIPIEIEIEEGDQIITQKVAGSTTDLNTAEFNEYVEEVIQFAAEHLDIQIPYPNE